MVRVFKNARDYNNVNTVYYKNANELEKYITPYLDQLKEDDDDLGSPSGDMKKSSIMKLSKHSKKIKKKKR